MGLIKKNKKGFEIKSGDTVIQNLASIGSISYDNDGTPKNVPILAKKYTVKVDGVYRISFTSASKTNTSSQKYKFSYMVNGVEKQYYLQYIPYGRKTLTGDISLKKGDVLQLNWSNMGIGASTLSQITVELKVDINSFMFNEE